MKQVQELFKIGYNHIDQVNNIKLYNKTTIDFIEYYDLKITIWFLINILYDLIILNPSPYP
jgi:hypothetical protein